MTRLIPVVVLMEVFLATAILVLLHRLFRRQGAAALENIRREMAVMLQILPVATGELECQTASQPSQQLVLFCY